MAQRAKAKKTDKSAVPAAKAKSKPPAGGSTSRANRTKSAVTGGSARDLEAECASLRRELTAAKAEIAQLQKRQELVVNRIDWVIDSLHNLMEDEG